MHITRLAPAMALLLAGCGIDGNSTDFTIAVKGDHFYVLQELANMEPDMSLLGGEPVTMTSEEAVLIFTIPSADGYDDGEVRMEVAENGGRAMVDVSVDIPKVSMGGATYLSEQRVEAELKSNMRDWAERYERSASSSTAEIAMTLGAVALAAQKIDLDDAAGAFDFAGLDTQDDGWGDNTTVSQVDYDTGDGWGEDSGYDAGGWGN